MLQQLNIVFLLLGCIQGWIISFILLYKKPKHQQTYWLVALLTVFGIQLTFKVFTKTWLWTYAFYPYHYSYSLPYLVGPILYLLLLSRVRNIQKIDFLHFSPFVLSLILITMKVVLWPNYQSHLIFVPTHAYANALLQISSLIGYGYQCLVITKLHHDMAKLKSFVIAVVICEIIVALILGFMVMYNDTFPDVRILFVGLTGLIYIVSYNLIQHPDFLNFEEKNPKKYKHSGLKAEVASKIKNELIELFHKKIYADPEINIDRIAMEIKVSRHHVSQVINESYGKNLTEVLNEFRLAEAHSKLADRRFTNLTIAAIALDSGFNSISSFNVLFKKKFGTTPSSYRQKALNS